MKDNCLDTPVNRGLQHLENAYIIPAPCIISQDKIVRDTDSKFPHTMKDNFNLALRYLQVFA